MNALKNSSLNELLDSSIYISKSKSNTVFGNKTFYLSIKSILKIIIPTFIFSFIPREVMGGLDKYSFLDKIDNWIIERKIDSYTNKVLCRASIPNNGTWFSERTRLDRNDEIIYPLHLKIKKIPNSKSVDNVRKNLRKCRSGLIYIQEFND